MTNKTKKTKTVNLHNVSQISELHNQFKEEKLLNLFLLKMMILNLMMEVYFFGVIVLKYQILI